MLQVDLLAFGAHPDDVEIGMGGILAKHHKLGYTTAICDLTEAELSSNGTVETRRTEAVHAAKMIGVKKRINLKFPDRGLDQTIEQIDQIATVIRRYRPKIVFAPFTEDRHPDHVRCGQMVQEAIFNAGLVNKRLGDEASHRVEQFYYYFIHGMEQADVIVDVSEVYESKMLALQAYQTQFTRTHGGVATPINDPLFFERIRGKDLFFGHQVGVAYGEALVRTTPAVVSTLL